MKRLLRDFKRYFPYAKYAAKSNLKSEVANSYLNWIWWILEPILFDLVYWFIFVVIFGQSKAYFHIFVFIGLSLWNFFSKTVSSSVRIVINNRGVVTKVYIPKFYLILIAMAENFFKMLISFGIVVVLMIFARVEITFNVLYVIPIMIDLLVLTFGVSTIIAHFGVFFDDLKNFVDVGLRVLFYMSGIFYVVSSKIDEAFAVILLKINPMGFLIDGCREAMLYCGRPSIRWLVLWFVIGITMSIVGIMTIYKNENTYAKVI